STQGGRGGSSRGRAPGSKPAPKATSKPGPRNRGPSRATVIRRRMIALVMVVAVIGALVWAGFWAAPHIANVWESIFSNEDEPAPVAEETETEVPTDRAPCEASNLTLDYDVEVSSGQAPVTFATSITVDDIVGCLFNPAAQPI